MNTVLFACVHNAGRSQMAAAWFNSLSDPTRARAISAGTEPGPRVHPEVVTAMSEVGFDLSAAPTTKLTPELAANASMLITMGCGDQCPVVPGVKRADWPLEDPKDKPIDRVRVIRDEIRSRVEKLVWKEGWASLTTARPPTFQDPRTRLIQAHHVVPVLPDRQTVRRLPSQPPKLMVTDPSGSFAAVMLLRV